VGRKDEGDGEDGEGEGDGEISAKRLVSVSRVRMRSPIRASREGV
jgi:hypothetical protein